MTATQAHSLVVVPVMVSYDRVFEQLNLAGEMVSGENRHMSFWEVLYKVFNFSHGQLGSCYVKYLEPIRIKDFLDQSGVEPSHFSEA